MRPEQLLNEASWKTLMKNEQVTKDDGLERALGKYKSSTRDDPRGEKQVAALDEITAVATRLLGEKEIRAKREVMDYLDDLKNACRDIGKEVEKLKEKATTGPTGWKFTKVKGSVGVILDSGGSQHYAKVGEVLPAGKKWLVVTPAGGEAEVAYGDDKVKLPEKSLLVIRGESASRGRLSSLADRMKQRIVLTLGKTWKGLGDMFGKDWAKQWEAEDRASGNAATGVRG
jgi:hypothetical protein